MVEVATCRAAVAPHTEYAVTLGNPVTASREPMKAPATGRRKYNRPRSGAIDSIPRIAVASSKLGALQCHDQHLITSSNACSSCSGERIITADGCP